MGIRRRKRLARSVQGPPGSRFDRSEPGSSLCSLSLHSIFDLRAFLRLTLPLSLAFASFATDARSSLPRQEEGRSPRRTVGNPAQPARPADRPVDEPHVRQGLRSGADRRGRSRDRRSGRCPPTREEEPLPRQGGGRVPEGRQDTAVPHGHARARRDAADGGRCCAEASAAWPGILVLKERVRKS